MMPGRSIIARVLTLGLATLVAVGAASGLSPATAAAAEDKEPLRLVFLNSDPADDGTEVYDALASVLDASNDIELIDRDALMAAGDSRGVTIETFQDGDLRARHVDTFEEMLGHTRAEAVVVLDVFSSGDTMQLVTIGPHGKELSDVRESISGGKPSQEQCIAVLRKLFKTLVPKVRAYRKEKKAPKKPGAKVGLLGEGGNEGKESDDDERLPVNPGGLSAGMTPHLGMILGRRKLKLDTEADYQLSHASPFVGFGGEIDAIFAVLDDGKTAVGATIYGAFAPFTTVFTDVQNNPVELPSSYSNFRFDLKYVKEINPNLVVDGKVGAEMMSVTIKQNKAYTGNSYINLRAGGDLKYQFGRFAEFKLAAAVLPTIDAAQSGTAMGPADLGFGFNGGATLNGRLFEAVEVSLGYGFQYYSVTFSSPELDDLNGKAATTTDTVHLANVMIGYDF